MPSTRPQSRPTILRLAVPSPLRRLFDYLPPADLPPDAVPDWQPGIRLLVPFGRRKVIAVLLEIADQSDLAPEQLKQAIRVLDEQPVFPPALLRTLVWAAGYYQHPPGEVFSTALPAKLRQGADRYAAPETGWAACEPSEGDSAALLKRAPRQLALWSLLQSRGPLTTQECLQAGFSAAILNNLASRGLAAEARLPTDNRERPFPVLHPDTVIPANTEQLDAIEHLGAALGSFSCHLLDGVTGSGKTEVYMQVIAKVLEANRQALVLVPEIGLTPQSVDRFRARFTCDVVALHSGLTDNERLAGWRKAADGTAGIVIGTRSAIFTPLARPGLIIIDEEHDSSFKQQDGFRYSARDLAIVRAREEDTCIILGSATPSLESLFNARSGRYSHLVLSERAGAAVRAPIRLLDVSATGTADGLSPLLLDVIGHHLNSGNQVLVFINRRGFAPTLTCQDCGHVFECSRCDTQLTVHRTPPSLQCHHCEARQAIPRTCLQCGSRRLATLGIGTEKTEQLLKERFAGTPILRIDRDSTRRKNALTESLDKVLQGEPCILVGTQMLAKGHHFPQVTLVAILDADSGLFSADFRGQEHMLQLLFQVAGRAGREQSPGQVVVQTRHAGHEAFQALVAGDYLQIGIRLLEERQQARMPPFTHLTLIRSESPSAEEALSLLNAIYTAAQRQARTLGLAAVEVHKPLPAPMERRAGRFRAQLLLRSVSRGALQNLLTSLCPYIETLKQSRRVRWSIDVDPQDLT